MKKTTILCSLAASLILASPLRAAEILSLPEPDKKGGMPLMQALTERKSSRDFIPGSTLTLQQTSDLLYAAFGVNRPNGNRTAPTALNFQDITVYICQADNVCKYDAANHQLIKIADGDYRKDCGMQKEMHQNAAAVLIFVSETEKITRGTDEQKKIYGDELSLTPMSKTDGYSHVDPIEIKSGGRR